MTDTYPPLPNDVENLKKRAKEVSNSIEKTNEKLNKIMGDKIHSLVHQRDEAIVRGNRLEKRVKELEEKIRVLEALNAQLHEEIMYDPIGDM